MAAPMPQRHSRGVMPAVATSSRSWRKCSGSGMRIGQVSSQRPQAVQALGSSGARSNPVISGVSTEPIGPG